MNARALRVPFFIILPVLLCGIFCLTFSAIAASSDQKPETAMISEAFEILHRVGDAANSGGGSVSGTEVLQSACGVAAQLGQNRVDDVWASLSQHALLRFMALTPLRGQSACRALLMALYRGLAITRGAR